MIAGNKIAHEWMVEYISNIKSLKTAKAEDMLKILDRADQYKYRLVEDLGQEEFEKQVKSYSDKYDRLNK